MRERFFESGRMHNKAAIKRDLEDAGIDHVDQWQEALDIDHSIQKIEDEKHLVKVGTIDDALWQEQLDSAFKKGDYALITTLRRVRPQSVPDERIIKSKMNELVMSQSKKWADDFSQIQFLFKVAADQHIVHDEFGKLLEKYGTEKGVLDRLNELKRVTGYLPTAEQVQAKYRDVFKNGLKYSSLKIPDLVRNIKNLSGIQPDMSIFQEVIDSGDVVKVAELAPLFGVEDINEMAQQAYENDFAKNGCLDFVKVRAVGKMPTPDLIQRIYQRIVADQRQDWPDQIKYVERETGIKPVYSVEQLQPIFSKFLSNGWYGKSGYVGVKDIIEMSGMLPSEELVLKTALELIDYVLHHEVKIVNSGSDITERLNRLRENVGRDFQIPESEIQARYVSAMSNKNWQAVINLYGAFKIKPKIEHETARRFMVEYIDELGENPLPKLEEIFGFKLQATPEEIASKQDSDLEEYEFDKIAQIRITTGKKCPKSKLKTALAKLLEIEATTPPHDRTTYEKNWQDKIRKHLKQFALTFNPETVVAVYNALAQNEVVYAENFSKIFELTGVPLPSDLAQRVCKKILSPDYVTYGTSQRKTSYNYPVQDALSVVYGISLVRPAVSREDVQLFYISELKSNSYNADRGIRAVSEITGIQPQWNPAEVQSLYKHLILNSKEDSVKSIHTITGISPVLDTETLAYVLGKLESSIETVGAIDYQREEHRLWSAIATIKKMVGSTYVRPNTQRLQTVYTEILKNDPYWQVKISQLAESTRVVPKIPREHIQVRGEQLLQNGDTRAFQQLLKYGNFLYTPTIIEKTYAALLAASQPYDTQNTGNLTYNENWVEDIRKFKEMSGTAPTNVQLNELFGRLVADSKFVRKCTMGGVLHFYTTEFGTTISQEHAQLAYKELFATGNLIGIEEVKKKIGIAPEIPTDIMREKCNFWLKSRDFQTLKYVKLLFGLDKMPISPELVQAEYHNLIKSPAFADSSHKDSKIFYMLFDWTGIRPEFTPEQLSMAYQKVLAAATDGNYDAFERVVGVPPTAIDLQKRIITWMDRYGQKENIVKFIARNIVVQTPETISNLCLHILEKAHPTGVSSVTKSLKLIEDVFKTRVRLEANSVEGFFVKFLETDKDIKLDVLFPWFEELTGQKPSQNLVDSAYKITLGKKIFNDSKEGDGRFEAVWDWLKKRYGLPSKEAIQAVYLAELSSNNAASLHYIQQSTRIKPDVKEMMRINKAKGGEAGEQQIYVQLQNLFEKELLQGSAEEIERLENQFGYRMKIAEADLQILYTRIVMVDDMQRQRNSFKFGPDPIY
jgi:hypothetical protein